MGRASRLARALGAQNKGNRARIVVAHGECITLLAGDLRIQEQFRDWVRAMDQHARDGVPAWVQSEADLHRVMAAIETAQIEYLAGVLQGMGVPWRWCAEGLIKVSFPIMRHNARHPDDLRLLRVEAPTLGLATGQAPPHDGQEIAENVRWWYRAKVKHPPDSIHALAKEWAEREKRLTDARSVVQDGIKRAEILLNGKIPR